MVKLKKYRVHKAICSVCNGNGYVKIMKEDTESHVHQCWECDSEGEFYVYEPKMVTDDDTDNDNRNTDKFLH
jgi:hypothetical protein